MIKEHFRTQKRAAPLKLVGWRVWTVAAEHFRTQKRAAPLKRRSRKYRLDEREIFPHAKTCGPIEAGAGGGQCGSGPSRFPHAKTCGPIEANGSAYGHTNCFDFRTQKRAAPLKLASLWPHIRAELYFRTQKRAAPLKL